MVRQYFDRQISWLLLSVRRQTATENVNTNDIKLLMELLNPRIPQTRK